MTVKKLNSNSNSLTLKKLNLNSLILQKSNSNSSIIRERIQIQIQSNLSRNNSDLLVAGHVLLLLQQPPFGEMPFDCGKLENDHYRYFFTCMVKHIIVVFWCQCNSYSNSGGVALGFKILLFQAKIGT